MTESNSTHGDQNMLINKVWIRTISHTMFYILDTFQWRSAPQADRLSLKWQHKDKAKGHIYSPSANKASNLLFTKPTEV